jgi:hypothetical protein
MQPVAREVLAAAGARAPAGDDEDELRRLLLAGHAGPRLD